VEESVIKDDPAHTSRTEVEDTVSVKYEYIGKEIPPLHLLPHVQNLAMISSPAQRAVKASPVRRLGGRGPWIAVLAGLLLSAAGFGIWVFLKPGRPLSTFIRGSTVEARDQNGRVCWKKDLPFLSPKARWESGEMQQDLSLIEDIDEDGQIEVLINFVPEERSAARARLICYAENGRLRWEYPLGRALSYQGRSFDERYIGRMIRLVRHPQQSYLEVVSAHELWYPTQVALLEPSSGKLIDEYWHPGSLRHCVLQDLDKDGLQELLLAGLNNPGLGLGHAAFLVLKVPFSSAPRKDEGPFAVFTGG
jgi:hypothetical protein